MKKLLTLVMAFSLMIPVASAAAFVDVSSNFQFRAAINFIADQGIVQGYSDGTYKPNQQINRAEFTKIIIEAKYPKQATGSGCFGDVNNEWFASYVCFAKLKGIIGGNPDGTFRAGNNINTAEAYKIVLATMVDDPKFTEGAQWYDKYLNFAKANKLNFTTNLDAGHLVTRGEMAQMVYLVMNGPAQDEAKVEANIGVYQKAILELVNIERAKVNLPALTYNLTLERSAYLHAKDMADKKYFDHISPTGTTPEQRMSGYYSEKNWTSYEVGENIWMWEQPSTLDAQALAQIVMNDPNTGWMQSPLHRANILHPEFQELGVGYFKTSDGQVYYVQNFGVIEVAK